ncbi:MAG: hypothetical protein IJA81_10150 [Akkermansia sp.]|nr:hypothetical protein [Akkermansia sp.]
MFRYSTALSVIALAAVSAPYVCQAQDPAGKFKRITALSESGKVDEALKMCDDMLKYFAGKSRTVQQYSFYEPFFVWKKGELLMAAKKYDEAYETYKRLNTDPKFQDKAMRDRAKRRKLLNGQGFDPYLTASQYYMGACMYQKGVGDSKKGVAADPAAFDKAIPVLKEYLDLYQGGKVSKMEKDLKLDGQICFMLMQAYILQSTPDFKTAGSYLERGRKSKGAIPDEMAMAGLSTIINVAMKNPEAISWVRDIIVSNPQSYSLGPVRMARHGSTFFGPAQNCQKMFSEAMKNGEEKKANDSARSAMALMGMVPNVNETLNALKQMTKVIGTSKMKVADLDGAVYTGSTCKTLIDNYTKSEESNKQLDAFAVQLSSSIALDYGCHRMAKAGYGILVDRYPDLQGPEKDGKPQPLGDKLKQGYAQLCRTTGDNEKAQALEQGLKDSGALDPTGELALKLNLMIQAQKDKQWEDVMKYADEALASSAIQPTSANYMQCHLSKINALKSLKREKDAIAAIEKVLTDDVVGKATDATEEIRVTADKQLRYTLCASFFTVMREGGSINSEYLDKIQQCVRDYELKYPNEDDRKKDQFLPHMYFFALNSLLLRSNKEDFVPAKELCDKFLTYYEGHEYHASVLTVKANIIITLKDKPNFEIAIRSLEKAVEVAFARPEGKGKPNAGEALNKLAMNGRLVNLTKDDGSKETEEEKTARYLGYFKTFWEQVDAGAETNRFALQMARLHLGAVKADDAAFQEGVKRAEDTIVREAAYAHAQKKLNPEVSKTINYVVNAKIEKESMALDAIKAYVGTLSSRIAKDDKSTQASLSMEVLGALSTERDKYVGDDTKKSELAAVDAQIEEALGTLSRDYKPAELTNDICYTIGEYLRGRAPLDSGDQDAINKAIDRALPYYREAIKRGGDMIAENKCGLADALAATGDKANLTEADGLYEAVMKSQADFEVVNRARLGKANSLLAGGDYNGVLDLTKAYLEQDSDSDDALRMRIMQAGAYEKLGKLEEAINIHYNITRDYTGSLGVSAPACEKMMKLLWERGKGQYKDNQDGTFDHTDKWVAWNRGVNYVKMVEPMFEDAATSSQIPKSERDAFTRVRNLVDSYGDNAAVRDETRREQADLAKYN